MPSFIIPIHEYNPNHEPSGGPKGGQFASSKGTRVGITSARPAGDPGFRTNRQAFGEDMGAFGAALRALPGVRNVAVHVGIGGWDGGREPSWIVSYTGNGAAKRLLAQTGKQFNQDAVLLMHGCRGADCDAAVEFTFDRPVNGARIDKIGQVLVAGGLQGWTWGRRGGKTVLRMVSVPAWGGERTAHLTKTSAISVALAAQGLTHKARTKNVRTEVLDRDAGDYDRTLGLKP